MKINDLKRAIELMKSQVGDISSYEFHIHSETAKEINKEVLKLDETLSERYGIRITKFMDFPVVINDTVPPDKVYFVDREALNKLKGAL